MSIINFVYSVIILKTNQSIDLPLCGGSEINQFITISNEIDKHNLNYSQSSKDSPPPRQLKPGDILLQINDISISGLTSRQVHSLWNSLTNSSQKLSKVKLFLIPPHAMPTKQTFINSVLYFNSSNDPFLRNLQISIRANINCPNDFNIVERRIPKPPVRNSSIIQKDDTSSTTDSIKVLPFGWERVVDPHYGLFFIDHINKSTQYQAPKIPESAMDLKFIDTFISLNDTFLSMISSGEYVIKTVHLKRNLDGFGFTITGGIDSQNCSFIQVSHITPGGAADLSKNISLGDILLSVNDLIIYDPKLSLNSTNSKSPLISIFKSIDVGESVKLTMLQKRVYPAEKIPSLGHLFNVSLLKTNDGFGFTLSDTAQGQVIKSVNRNNDIVKENDILIQLNGEVNLLAMSHLEIVDLLKSLPVNQKASFLIARKNIDDKSIENQSLDTPLKENESLTSNSVIYEIDSIDQYKGFINDSLDRGEDFNDEEILNVEMKAVTVENDATYATINSAFPKKSLQNQTKNISVQESREIFSKSFRSLEYNDFIKWTESNSASFTILEVNISPNSLSDYGFVLKKSQENPKLLLVDRIMPGGCVDRDGILSKDDVIFLINDLFTCNIEADVANAVVAELFHESFTNKTLLNIKFLRSIKDSSDGKSLVEVQQLEENEDCYGDIDTEMSKMSLISFNGFSTSASNAQPEDDDIYEVLNQPAQSVTSEKSSDSRNLRCVVITRDKQSNEGFGLVIVGASSINRPNIIGNSFIGQIIPGGAAERTGQLKVYDRVLMVNKKDVSNLTHEEIVKLIRETPSNTVELVVENLACQPPVPQNNALPITPVSKCLPYVVQSRIPPNRNMIMGSKESLVRFKVTLFSKNRSGFGFGVKWFLSKNPNTQRLIPRLHITSIQSDGPASIDGRLKIYDQIIELNSKNLLQSEFDLKEITELLRSIQTSSQILHLTCQRKVIIQTNPKMITNQFTSIPNRNVIIPNNQYVRAPKSLFLNEKIILPSKTTAYVPYKPQNLIVAGNKEFKS